MFQPEYMRKISKKVGKQIIHFIEVTEDAYNFNLITNKNLKNRYGKFEWTSRKDGLDRVIKFDNIENIVSIVFDYEMSEGIAEQIVGESKKKDALKRYKALKKELGIITEKKEKPVQKGNMLESNASYFKRLGKWMVYDEKVWKKLLILIETI